MGVVGVRRDSRERGQFEKIFEDGDVTRLIPRRDFMMQTTADVVRVPLNITVGSDNSINCAASAKLSQAPSRLAVGVQTYLRAG
jgi:hypothetical protein